MRALLAILLLFPTLAYGQSPVRLGGAWVVPVRAADGFSTAQQILSTIATGTAPIIVNSTTPVTGLSITGNAGTATALFTPTSGKLIVVKDVTRAVT